ncbi:MAG TPA: hypothetical protein VNT55_05385, partial [Baekduia sp.]|nr:hypothetical protein [Baekduia sp.]
MITRLLAAAAAAATTLLLATSVASAAPTVTPLTPVADDSPLSAYGGWVVWSERDAEGKWSLWTYHHGIRARIERVRKLVPFDADVGPDDQGRPTVTFSRCKVEPSPDSPQPWSTAKGCRPRAVTLGDGMERALHVGHRPDGGSDSTPSLWRGRVAFQRRVPGSDVSRLMAYDFTTHRLTTLPHGAVPHACPYTNGCPKARPSGEVGELDLGARAVAYSWHVAAPGMIGVGPGWELRLAPTGAGRRTVLAGNGYVSGACGARTPYSP